MLHFLDVNFDVLRYIRIYAYIVKGNISYRKIAVLFDTCHPQILKIKKIAEDKEYEEIFDKVRENPDRYIELDEQIRILERELLE